jgi:hypothetical protein
MLASADRHYSFDEPLNSTGNDWRHRRCAYFNPLNSQTRWNPLELDGSQTQNFTGSQMDPHRNLTGTRWNTLEIVKTLLHLCRAATSTLL